MRIGLLGSGALLLIVSLPAACKGREGQADRAAEHSGDVPQIKVVPGEIDSIRVQDGGKTEFAFERHEARWVMTLPHAADNVRQDAIASLLQGLARVSVSEVLYATPDPVTLARYRLEDGRATHIQVGHTGSTVLDLRVGEDGSSQYNAIPGTYENIGWFADWGICKNSPAFAAPVWFT